MESPKSQDPGQAGSSGAGGSGSEGMVSLREDLYLERQGRGGGASSTSSGGGGVPGSAPPPPRGAGEMGEGSSGPSSSGQRVTPPGSDQDTEMMEMPPPPPLLVHSAQSGQGSPIRSKKFLPPGSSQAMAPRGPYPDEHPAPPGSDEVFRTPPPRMSRPPSNEPLPPAGGDARSPSMSPHALIINEDPEPPPLPPLPPTHIPNKLLMREGGGTGGSFRSPGLDRLAQLGGRAMVTSPGGGGIGVSNSSQASRSISEALAPMPGDRDSYLPPPPQTNHSSRPGPSSASHYFNTVQQQHQQISQQQQQHNSSQNNMRQSSSSSSSFAASIPYRSNIR